MKIIEVINIDTKLSECELSIGNEQMIKEDREANVVVHFNWYYDGDDMVVYSIEPIEMSEVYFFQEKGNYFAVLNHAKSLATIENIQTLINE